MWKLQAISPSRVQNICLANSELGQIQKTAKGAFPAPFLLAERLRDRSFMVRSMQMLTTRRNLCSNHPQCPLAKLGL